MKDKTMIGRFGKGLGIALGAAALSVLPLALSDSFASKDSAEEAQDLSSAKGIASVNGRAITQADVDEELLWNLGMRTDLPEETLEAFRSQMTPQILDLLVTRSLLSQAADREEISVSAGEIEEIFAEMAATLPPGKSLDEAISEMGLEKTQWEKKLAKDLKIQKLLAENISEGQEPTDEAVEAFYRDHQDEFFVPETARARHILIAYDEADDEAGKAAKLERARALRERLVGESAEDFARVAQEASDCPSSSRGGDLGAFGKGGMVAPFEEAAFGQEVGEIGEIVETQFGLHIIRVEERSEARTIGLHEARGRIAQKLRQDEMVSLYDAYVSELRENAEIDLPSA